MSDTLRLALPKLSAAQAQKHVTHNDALAVLDALVHLSVKDRDLAAPPASPGNGDRYLVAAGATGAWVGRSGQIANHEDGVWRFHVPARGWIVHVEDENGLLVHDGAAWSAPTGLFSRLGVNATADATNRVAISAANVLVTDEGAGVQVKVNKTAAGNTASYLFQTGYSGRAEFGLVGGDDFKLKVSANGTTWVDALTVNRTTGGASFAALAVGSTAVALASDLAAYLPLAGGTMTAQLRIGSATAYVVDGTAAHYQQLHSAGNQSGMLVARWSANNNAPVLVLAKSRGSGVGTHGAVTNGTEVGAVVGAGSDGSAFVTGARLVAVADGAATSGIAPMKWSFETMNAAGLRPERFGIRADGALEHRAGATILADANSHLGLRSYTVATLPSASVAARLIYVSDGTANKRLAVSDGTNWRFPDGAIVS